MSTDKRWWACLMLTLLLAILAAFLFGMSLLTSSYRQGFEAGQRAADQDAVYAAVGDALRVGVRLAALSDSVARVKQQMDRQAAQHLPQRVIDSLRTVRWTTPASNR